MTLPAKRKNSKKDIAIVVGIIFFIIDYAIGKDISTEASSDVNSPPRQETTTTT